MTTSLQQGKHSSPRQNQTVSVKLLVASHQHRHCRLVERQTVRSHVKANSKRHRQRRVRLRTDAGKVMTTTWKVADVRKPWISASRFLENGTQTCVAREPANPTQERQQHPPWTVSQFVCSTAPDWRSRLCSAGHFRQRNWRTQLERSRTEGRESDTGAAWLVARASDWAGEVDAGQKGATVDEEQTDHAVGADRTPAAPRAPMNAEREAHHVCHVTYRAWRRFCVMGRGLVRRHLNTCR